MSTNFCERINNILSNREYYSLEINYMSKLSSIPIEYLRLFGSGCGGGAAARFSIKYNDQINIFKYNGVEYFKNTKVFFTT
jgi:hypothetical protein